MFLVNSAVPFEALVRDQADLLAEVLEPQILQLLLSHRVDLTSILSSLHLRLNSLMLLLDLARPLFLVHLNGLEVVLDARGLGCLLLLLYITIVRLLLLVLLEGFLLITLTREECLPFFRLGFLLSAANLSQVRNTTKLVRHSLLDNIALHLVVLRMLLHLILVTRYLHL
jgi:hypothetical protein